jgi:transposase
MTFSSVPLGTAGDQTDFLMLCQWRTIAVMETASAYEVEALPLSQPSACPHCDSPAAALRLYSTRRQMRKDAPVRRKHVRIHFTQQRYHCENCKRFSLQPLFGINERRSATDRLVEMIGAEAFSKTFSMVSEETGSSPKSVADIFTERVLEIIETVTLEPPRVLGLDEVYIKGQAHCVLTDLETPRLFELLPKSDTLSLCRYLLQLPQRDRVEVIVMDLRRSHLELIRRLFPQGTVVINKWQIWQLAQHAALKVLKKAREGSIASRQPRLRSGLYLLTGSSRLSKADLEERAELFERIPELGEAYRLRQEFLDIWKFKDRQKAETRYEQWVASIPPELQYAFGDLLKIMNRWHREVFNYFDYRFTNAYTGSVDRKIKMLQSMSSRYSFDIIRAKVLYGGFAKRALPAPTRKMHALKDKLKKARPKARRAPAPRTPANNSERLRQAQDSKDEFNDLLRQPDGWLERFQFLARKKRSGH